MVKLQGWCWSTEVAEVLSSLFCETETAEVRASFMLF